MEILARVLDGLGIGGRIGADQDGYPGILGYQGPSLGEATGASVTSLAVEIEAMLARKSDAEIALIRQSARWCEHAHRLLQDSTRPGVTEAEASLRAGHEATLALLRAAGDGDVGPARVGGRRPGGLPGADRPAQRVGARDRPQHRVSSRRRPRHRDERPDLGLQRRARACPRDRPADRSHAVPVRPRRGGAAGRLRVRSGPASRARTSTAQ